MKKFAIALIIFGIGCLCAAAYDLYSYKLDEDKTLEQAENLLEESKQAKQRQSINSDQNEKASADKEDEQRTRNNINNKIKEKKDYQFKVNDVMGILTIPKIGAKLPIVEGTNPKDLKKGVGHHSTTALPGQSNMILLAGHRDTVFRKMGQLENGDRFTLELPFGTFTYEMRDHKIVEKDDTSIIKSTAPEEVLVLSTCYPFRYLGDAPQRYIIYAYPV